MMTLRAFDARMQMAQRQGKTSFYMQHTGEEAVSCAFRRALRPGDMNFPTYRQAGPADRRRLSDGRHDEPDLLQRERSAQGPPAARALFLEGARLLHRFRQPRDAIRPGGRLGDGLGHQGRHAGSPPAGSATAPPPKPISTPRSSSPPPTGRRWCSTSSTTSGRSRPSRASRAAARALSRRAASASASPRCAWMATTTSPSMRSPKWAVERARRNLGADADRIRHLSRRRAFDLGRSLRLPAESRVRGLAARRSGDPAQEASDRARRLVGRAPRAGRSGSARRGDRGAEGGRDATAPCTPAASPRRATIFEGVFAEMPPHLRRQRQEAGV